MDGEVYELPVSFAQRRIWLLDQFDPDGTAYLVPWVVRLDGPVDRVDILSRGVSPLVRIARFVARSGRSAEFTGIELRSTLGLRDSWFRVIRRTMPRSAAARLVGGT